ncbi:MAG: hypothetical protein OXU19_05800 [bacterium]|nr:hypothetical protein [bacterium]MDE0238998.1 hypothetical protein [bacterium]MDE0417125.1 hypothetical protein [bacterium]
MWKDCPGCRTGRFRRRPPLAVGDGPDRDGLMLYATLESRIVGLWLVA